MEFLTDAKKIALNHIALNVIKSHIIYNIYFQSEMQRVEENIWENNNVPAHHPSSLNIYTFNKAKFHIQAQQEAMCSNIRLFAGSGWAGVACSHYSLGLIVKPRMWKGFVAWLEVQGACCAYTDPRTHFINLTLYVL